MEGGSQFLSASAQPAAPTGCAPDPISIEEVPEIAPVRQSRPIVVCETL
jgi:hypothetical protein